MVCCTIIALIIGPLVWLLRKLTFRSNSPSDNPLTWTLSGVEASPPQPTMGGFSWTTRAQSFRYAINGLKTVVKEEHNAWIHIGAAVIAIALGVFLEIDLASWRWIIFSIGLVLFAETMNTAVEQLCDAIHPQHDPAIGLIKDVAAGAVLLCAATAILIGVTTFAPYIHEFSLMQNLDICRS